MSYHHRRHHCRNRDFHPAWLLIVGVLIMFSACDDEPTTTSMPAHTIEQGITR